MDVDKLFKNIRNLNQYICVTEEICRKFKDQKILLNMPTVLSLKKVRSLEIEYFNKCDGNGAAFVIIERMLELPPSKTWGLLGKELISLVQYWLDATRKHLITHSLRWWLFLDFLLKFIKIIYLKDPALPDMLVEGTTERLLDLATKRQPNILQRQAILHCINLCSACSSRKIRFALRHHFDHYFIKLSSIMATSGDLPSQHTILETLIHWLLPRQNLAVKHAAAAKWFPSNLYKRDTVNIFLEREWKNFYQDARDFLNSHNEVSDVIVSANCRKVTIGATVALAGMQDRNVWLDVNSSSKSISILTHPLMLKTLGINDVTSFNYLVITEDNVQLARLSRQSTNVNIVIKMLHNLVLHPSGKNIDASELCVEVSSRTDLRRLDNFLRNILDDKYQGISDFENVPLLSPCNASRTVCETTDEDTRLSHPVQVTKRKRSGYMVRSKATYLKSPSSTSTTSLALLQDRLKALPKYNFDKEPVKVSLLPTLSNVSELTEVEDRHTFASCSTRKLRHYGAIYKGIANTEKKQRNEHPTDSSLVHNEHPTSCLLVATIGSDESVINDTLERLSKNKDYSNDNVVDLLVQEAFQSKENGLSDSGINICNYKKTLDLDVARENIENKLTLKEHLPSGQNIKVQTVTSDDSNEIKETQYEFVNVRKRNLVNKHKEKQESDDVIGVKESVYEEKAVKQLFSQHIVEDKQNGVNVSSTLVRKINETSSESDGEIDNVTNKCYVNIDNIHDNDVIVCLNNIVDIVCDDFDKYAEILNRDNTKTLAMDTINTDSKCVDNRFVVSNVPNIDRLVKGNKIVKTKEETKQKRNIKLKFNTKTDRRGKNQSTKPMSPIPEFKDTIEIEKELVPQTQDTDVDTKIITEAVSSKNKINSPRINNINVSPVSVNLDSPLVRKKHKLYSLEGIHIKNQKENDHIFGSEHDSNTVFKTTEIIKEAVSPKKILNSPELKDKNVSPGSDSSNTPLLIRKKRKLYSPKDEHIESEKENVLIAGIENDSTTKCKSNNVMRSTKFTATSYKEIEKERKKNIRQPRIRVARSKGKDPIPSPRSKKMNELFDTLKENVERNQNIILADKKSVDKELAIYNFTSDSEDDEDFKKKKIEAKKRISMKLTGNDSIINTRQTKWNSRNRMEKTTDKVIKKPVKQSKKSSNRRRPTQRKPYNLADERMREAVPEELNTSFILEKPTKVDKEPELVTEVVPQMEVITDEEYDKNEKLQKKKKIKANVPPLLKNMKTQKSKIPNEKTDNDDRTLSPLPELVVENVAVHDDLNDSLSSQMIMKQLKETYKVGPDNVDELNTTQNLLDDDKIEITSHNKVTENCRDEVNKKTNRVESKPKVKRNNKAVIELDKNEVTETCIVTDIDHIESQTQKCNIITISSNSGGKSEKSINTVGKSPITAHGDMNEAPPDFELLNETVQPRNLELENLDPSLKDYFLKLRDDINNLPVPSKKTNIKIKQPYVVLEKIDGKQNEDTRSRKSPTVSIPQLSHDNIRQLLPSRKNSESESSSSEKLFKSKTLKVSQPYMSNTNETNVRVTKYKELEKNNSSARSNSSSNETTTKTSKKRTYKQKRLKDNRNNKAKSKAVGKNAPRTVLHKNNTNNISEEDPKLVPRILQTRNLDSNTDSIKNKKDNAFVSGTHTDLRQASDSDSSTISSIKFDDIDPIITLHDDKKSAKYLETSNNPKGKNIVAYSKREAKKIEALTDQVLKLVNDIDNSLTSSMRFDDIEPMNTQHKIKKGAENPGTSNNPRNKRPAETLLFITDKSVIIPIKSNDNESLNMPDNTEITVKNLETSEDPRIEENNDFKDVKRYKRRSLSISSDRSKLSTRKDNVKMSAKSVSKRKSESPISDFGKRRKPESVLSGRRPSVSSVNDWFKKNAPLSSAESISQSYSDTLQNVMEKLDTTIAEIHQNTSKKFINLFVEVQKQLTELRTRKRNTFKQITTDILSEVTRILDVKFADLDARSQEMDTEFTQLLKNLSSEIIKEDFTQKCAMVVLLKEDFQAVADHLAKKMDS